MQIRRGIFFQSSPRNQSAETSPLPHEYRWGPVNEQAIIRDPIFAVKDRRIKAHTRLADGHACYGFFNQAGSVAYYMWITITHEAPKAVPWELNTQFILKPTRGYFWDCFTAPEHRRRGLYRAALNTASTLARTQGVEKSFICCLKENIPSINAIRSVEFRDIFEFTVRRIGPLVLCKRDGRNILVGFGNPKFNLLYE